MMRVTVKIDGMADLDKQIKKIRRMSGELMEELASLGEALWTLERDIRMPPEEPAAEEEG